MDEPLFDSQNVAYAQAMFEQYARNPESVPEAWRELFADGGGRAVAEGLYVPEQLNGHRAVAQASAAPAPAAAPQATQTPIAVDLPPMLESAAQSHSEAAEHLRRVLPVVSRAAALVQAFRDHGHQLAHIDPLGSEPRGHPQLSPAFFGTSMEELAGLPSSLVMEDDQERSVADALHELRDIYARSIGYEFEHLDDHMKVQWLWDQVETAANFPAMTPGKKRALLHRLTQVEGLEQFLHRAYLGQKRFSVEGTDMLVPMIDLAMEEAIRDGASEAVLGMAHRGRLNVLTHIVGVSYGRAPRRVRGAQLQGRPARRGRHRRREVPPRCTWHALVRGRRRDRRDARAEPEPPRIREPRGHGVRALPPVRRSRARSQSRQPQGRPDPHPRGRRLRRRGRRGRDAQHGAPRGLRRGRHRAHHRQQPGRLHHRSAGQPLDARTRATWRRGTASRSCT